MKYNPEKHHRRSIRLQGYDYSKEGMYFITLCCDGRLNRFGKIENKQMFLNENGKIAYDEWMKLPERFPNFELDVFQIMQNHIHGIIVLTPAVGAGFTPAHDDNDQSIDKRATARVAPTAAPTAAPTVAPTIGDIVGAYKSLVSNECLKIYKSNNEKMGKLWQRNFFEHIIRNEQSYQKISDYIINNPANWKNDGFYYG